MIFLISTHGVSRKKIQVSPNNNSMLLSGENRYSQYLAMMMAKRKRSTGLRGSRGKDLHVPILLLLQVGVFKNSWKHHAMAAVLGKYIMINTPIKGTSWCRTRYANY